MECNKAIVKMLNYNSKKEFLDTHPSQLSPEFQPDGQNSFDKANEMMAICLIEGFNEFDWIHTKSNGSNFWVRVTLNKIVLNNVDTIYVRWRDIDNEKNLELEREKHIKELIIAKEHAEQATKAKSDFLSIMSHELRTPMNAVLGFSQLMELDAKTKKEKEYCNEIIKAGKHLLVLINDVLDLAKIESGHIDINIKHVDIDNIICETLKLVTSLPEDKGVHINEYIATWLYVYADETRLKQALVNLISNATKYNKHDGSVKISVIPNEQSIITVNITDTGMGLNKNQLRDLFVPFERLGAECGIDGVGIGLYITKQLIESMNGKIGVRSTPNKGSTFWLELKSAVK